VKSGYRCAKQKKMIMSMLEKNPYNALGFARVRKAGIEMVYQQIHLLDYFTVAENLLIPEIY